MGKTVKVGKKKVIKTRKTTMKVKQIRKICEGVVAKNIENKSFQYLGTTLDLYPASNGIALDNSIIPCTPFAGYLAITQGTTQGSRLGNRILIKKLQVGGVIYPLPYNAVSNVTPCPCQIKVWFFYDKEETQAIPQPQAFGDFLQFGSSSLSLQNRLLDHYMPVNKDRYVVLTTRTYKLGYASYGGTGSQPQQGNFSNNDFKLNIPFNIDLTKHCVKNVIYRDTSSTPSTRGIFMMFQPVYANGNQMASTQIPAQVSYMLNVEYEDA